MPRFLCTVYTHSTRLRLSFTYTRSFGTDTHTWRFRPLLRTLWDSTDWSWVRLWQQIKFKASSPAHPFYISKSNYDHHKANGSNRTIAHRHHISLVDSPAAYRFAQSSADPYAVTPSLLDYFLTEKGSIFNVLNIC